MKIIKIQLIICLLLAGVMHSAKAQKGTLYPEFAESFENPGEIVPGYKKKTISLNTGTWYFFGARIDSTGNDRPVSGKFAARFVGNNTVPALVQMNFDLKEGASKVTLSYSSYGARADKPCTFSLEYSTDGGKHWTKSGNDVIADRKSAKTATFDLDLKGKVRFRISKPGLGESMESVNNGRLSIDDIAVYKN